VKPRRLEKDRLPRTKLRRHHHGREQGALIDGVAEAHTSRAGIQFGTTEGEVRAGTSLTVIILHSSALGVHLKLLPSSPSTFFRAVRVVYTFCLFVQSTYGSLLYGVSPTVFPARW
jgi:hypothetical protein